MFLKTYGIYLTYGPTVELRTEGLGRVLTDFLKAAATREDVRFVIACPEWSKKGLLALCENEGIPSIRFSIVSTDGIPLMLRLYLATRFRRKPRMKPARLKKLWEWLQRLIRNHHRLVEYQVFSTRSIVTLLAISAYVAILSAVALLAVAVSWPFRFVWRKLKTAAHALSRFRPFSVAGARLSSLLRPGGEEMTVRWYRLMEEAESQRLLAKIKTLPDVRAWYCPTAFWPSFNRIDAPRLICVPDVLPSEFPVGFATLDSALLESFEIVERSIRGSNDFLTYSAQMKWDTLVDRYLVPPEAVTVVPHASCDISAWIQVTGFADTKAATRQYCELLLGQALRRLGRTPYHCGLHPSSLRFLFYASQFRPNKNVPTLLRAYEHLLRKRYLPYKLILTGDPAKDPPVESFLRERNLDSEVICLHGLTTPELAACYHLAELAINPSLSEGGCPFTLTEALSVNTPVVMARIPVTEEQIEDQALREMMLFDPYDWRDIASKAEWALENREMLLGAQQKAFTKLRQRTWRHVVDECVEALDRIASAPAGAGHGS